MTNFSLIFQADFLTNLIWHLLTIKDYAKWILIWIIQFLKMIFYPSKICLWLFLDMLNLSGNAGLRYSQHFCNTAQRCVLTRFRLVTIFSNFSSMFLNHSNFSNLNYNWSNLVDMRNLQEQVKKPSVTKIFVSPFTAWINCSSDLKNFANSWPSSANFKSFFSISRTIFSHSRSEQLW